MLSHSAPAIPSRFPSETTEPTIGPVVAHRIAQIRRRLRYGRYALDSGALAAEIARYDGPCAAHQPAIAAAIEQLLSRAIDRLDHRAALVLQLEFVEQLASQEVAATMESDVGALVAVRSAALLKLKALLDCGIA